MRIDASWKDRGAPSIETYNPKVTRLSGMVRSIGMLSTGDIAAFDQEGMHVFNGSRWETVELDGWLTGLLALPNGDALIAGQGGLHRVFLSSDGRYTSEPLTPELAAEDDYFGLGSVAVARGRIFGLLGRDLVTVMEDGSARRQTLEAWSNGVFAIDEEIYFVGGRHELLNKWDWETESLQPFDHVLQESGYEWVEKVLPRAEGGVWMLTSENNVFGFDGTRSWVWPGSAILKSTEVEIRCLADFGAGELVVGTLSDGLLFFDKSGELTRQVSEPQGLDGAQIDAIGADGQGGIWAATRRGITRIDGEFQFQVFDERHGVSEEVEALEIFQGRLYAATLTGIYAPGTSQADDLEMLFRKVDDTREVRSMAIAGEALHLAGAQWVALDAADQMTVVRPRQTNVVWQPSRHPELVLGGDSEGIWVARRLNGLWQVEGPLPGLRKEVLSLAEAGDGSVWADLGRGSVGRISWDGEGIVAEEIALPGQSGLWAKTAIIEGEVYVNHDPVQLWDAELGRFVDAPEMIYYVGFPPFGFDHVFGRSDEAAFVCSNARNSTALPRPGRQVIGLLADLGNALENRENCLVYDEQGAAWTGGSFGITRSTFPSDRAVVERLPRITSITDLRSGERLPVVAEDGEPVRIPYRQNSIRVEVAYQNYASSGDLLYQIRLEGSDSNWQGWSESDFREFTNLSPGRYTLQVLGADRSALSSPVFALPFVIETPWYRTGWAFAAYALAMAAFTAMLIAVNNHLLRRRNKELARLVAERTAEIDAKNAELEEKNHELQHRSDELQQTTESLAHTLQELQAAQEQLLDIARSAGKAEVATNVLHTVGNVLNSVNVSLLSLIQKADESKVVKLGQLVALLEEHRRDLDRFITEDPRGRMLPDYLKRLSAVLEEERRAFQFELGVMEEGVDHIKNVISAQQSHAVNVSLVQKLKLRELCETAVTLLSNRPQPSNAEIDNRIEASLTVESDRHRILDILVNLLANAMDAIRENDGTPGLVQIEAAQDPETGDVALSIRDSGEGFPPDYADQLFRHGFTTKSDGHGFGLHSSANQAAALGGSLSLKSEGAGCGAVAILRLPARTPAPETTRAKA